MKKFLSLKNLSLVFFVFSVLFVIWAVRYSNTSEIDVDNGGTGPSGPERQTGLLAFQIVDVDKFLVLSNFRETGGEEGGGDGQGSIGSATIMHVRGTVYAQIDLSMVDFVRNRDSDKLEKITVVFPDWGEEGRSVLAERGEPLPFPVVFSASINSNQIEEVAVYENLRQHSPDAENVNTEFVVLGALTGGVVGLMVGSAVGRIPGLRQYRILTSSAGATVGAVAGGIGMHVMSNRLMEKIGDSAPVVRQSDRNRLVQLAPDLIVAEMLSDKSLREQFDAAAREYLLLFAALVDGNGQVDDVIVEVIPQPSGDAARDS